MRVWLGMYVYFYTHVCDICSLAFKEFPFNTPSTFDIQMHIICRKHTKKRLTTEMREKCCFEIPLLL